MNEMSNSSVKAYGTGCPQTLRGFDFYLLNCTKVILSLSLLISILGKNTIITPQCPA